MNIQYIPIEQSTTTTVLHKLSEKKNPVARVTSGDILLQKAGGNKHWKHVSTVDNRRHRKGSAHHWRASTVPQDVDVGVAWCERECCSVDHVESCVDHVESCVDHVESHIGRGGCIRTCAAPMLTRWVADVRADCHHASFSQSLSFFFTSFVLPSTQLPHLLSHFTCS